MTLKEYRLAKRVVEDSRFYLSSVGGNLSDDGISRDMLAVLAYLGKISGIIDTMTPEPVRHASGFDIGMYRSE